MTTNVLSEPTPQVDPSQPPCVLDQVAQAARQLGASEPTIAQLVSWVRAYVLFHGKRHPRELGLPAVSRFLEHVVRTELRTHRHVQADDVRCARRSAPPL